ncbi:MAG: formylglycine-generating enzyme family protein [Polyangiaceae bacterium]
MRKRVALCALPLLTACSDPAPPPLAEAVLEVDTNLAVPSLIQRLRVDLYSEDGAWFESRDIALPDPRDWPLSFSVYSADEAQRRAVWVRLRAYPEDGVRNYEGERFGDWGGSLVASSGDGTPRLVVNGKDQTPPEEPAPLLTVDRLLLVELEPGTTGRLPVVLDGACAGTMVRLSTESPKPILGEASSCIATAGVREPVERLLVRGGESSRDSQLGHFAEEPCPAPRTGAASVCVPGGAMVLGTQDLFLIPDLPPTPQRMVALRRFWLDRDEVSVGRYRAALAEGFAPPVSPNVRDADLGTAIAENCSFSSSERGRVGFALSCIDWRTARALCQFWGGDLPSEAQWEYAASRGTSRGSRYPWGNTDPTCNSSVFGRAPLAGQPGVCEATAGFGPLPADAGPGDVSPDGVHGLAGGLGEWCLDDYQRYDGDCWGASQNLNPGCLRDDARTRSVRGGSWVAPTPVMRSQARAGAPAQNRVAFIGVRCAYATEPAE